VKIGVPREITEGEERVGLVPETVERLVKEGFEVLVEAGAGRHYNLDENYEEAGATVVQDAGGVYGEADLIVKVAKPTDDEVGMMQEGQILVCFLNGPQHPRLVKRLAERGVTAFSNEAIPRTSVAQSMDALSSMGSIAGYKCALIGAIVHRLGGEVLAYDIRPETKEQAESLGASFIDSEDESEDEGEEDEFVEYEPTGFRKLMSSLGFYSFAEPPRDEYVVEGEEEQEDTEEEEVWSEEKLEEDQRLLRERIKEMDIVITTALVPGRQAPTLVDKEMVESMKPGSIIVDLAAEAGGNCELTEPGETVEHSQVRIIGPVNLPSAMPIHASQLYARNMHNLISHITEDRAEEKDEHDLHPRLDFEDEIIASTCIAHGGEIRDQATREALEEAPEESEAS
jgi:NAD(P) transhydrogenase subunit alpha